MKFDYRLTKFVLGHCALGAAIGVGFVALLLWFDIGNLGSLIFASDVPWLATSVLAAFFAITFGSVQVGIAVMLGLAEPGSDRR